MMPRKIAPMIMLAINTLRRFFSSSAGSDGMLDFGPNHFARKIFPINRARKTSTAPTNIMTLVLRIVL